MEAAYTAVQVTLMRFSIAIQSAAARLEPGAEEASYEQAQPLAAPVQDLPDDLDARVRLIGEWQLGEG